jgi:hypothetical protein
MQFPADYFRLFPFKGTTSAPNFKDIKKLLNAQTTRNPQMELLPNVGTILPK